MKFATALSTDTDPLRAVDQAAESVKAVFGKMPIDMLFLFITPHLSDAAEEVLKRIGRRLHPKHVLGATASSVVGGGREAEGGTAMSLLAASLPGAIIDTFRLTVRQTNGKYTFQGFPSAIDDKENRRAAILLADPFTTPVRDLLDQTNAAYPGLPVTGGLCSGGHGPGHNKMFLDDEVGHVGVMGALLSGDIAVETVVSQGCRPVGRTYLVTESEGNLIRTLGRRPALARLQEVFEEASEIDQRLIQTGLGVGVAMNEYQDTFQRGDFLIRNVVGIDQSSGAIAMMGTPRIGQTMQFHVRDAAAASEDLNALLTARAHEGRQYGGALLFTCNGRGERFFGQPNHDVDTLRSAMGDIPASGFFAAGEIGPVRGRTYVHGYTASMALIGEGRGQKPPAGGK
jgi:small ligand-binding sensory domain FIST